MMISRSPHSGGHGIVWRLLGAGQPTEIQTRNHHPSREKDASAALIHAQLHSADCAASPSPADPALGRRECLEVPRRRRLLRAAVGRESGAPDNDARRPVVAAGATATLLRLLLALRGGGSGTTLEDARVLHGQLSALLEASHEAPTPAVWTHMREVYSRTTVALEQALLELAATKREQQQQRGGGAGGDDGAPGIIVGGATVSADGGTQQTAAARNLKAFAPSKGRIGW
jgi:hypothetical protein